MGHPVATHQLAQPSAFRACRRSHKIFDFVFVPADVDESEVRYSHLGHNGFHGVLDGDIPSIIGVQVRVSLSAGFQGGGGVVVLIYMGFTQNVASEILE